VATDGDEVVTADVADTERVAAACFGVSAVVHLAAKGFEDDFMSVLLPRNIVGTYGVLEAARLAGVRVVVFASSGQTVGGNPEGLRITPDMPPRPISVYACTKLFGEALCRFYSDVHGMQIACLRLGWVVPPESPLFASEPTLPAVWCGPGDLATLIVAAIRGPVPFATVLAVSRSAVGRFDYGNPYGWEPVEVPIPNATPDSTNGGDR
jgi:nucleoside-diphosphate-sugar epimerase